MCIAGSSALLSSSPRRSVSGATKKTDPRENPLVGAGCTNRVELGAVAFDESHNRKYNRVPLLFRSEAEALVVPAVIPRLPQDVKP